MYPSFKPILIGFTSVLLVACTTTQTSTTSPATSNAVEYATITQDKKAQSDAQPGELTLEKIMADPDWMGRSPESALWSVDGKRIYFKQKRAGSVIEDWWQIDASNPTQPTLVEIDQLHLVASQDRVISPVSEQTAWIFKGNIFIQGNNDPVPRQLTHSSQGADNLKFLLDGRLSYQSGNGLYAVDTQTGKSTQLLSWQFAEKPMAVEPAKDYISREQLSLMSVLQKRRADRQAQQDYQDELSRNNPTMVPTPIYFPDKHRLVTISLSPDPRFAIAVTEEDKSNRDDTDIMPSYVVDSARIDTVSVRARVADAKPESHTLWLVDIQKSAIKSIPYSSLPGYNEDVLAEVKRENAKAKGEDYQTNRLPRDILLMQDWSWQQGPVQWHNNGNQVAIMLEAWDNKDRWIATVDLKNNSLINQHRLHDDAWVNYRFNSFGWLNNQPTLYFLSEQSGYSHLYLKPLDGKASQVTQGQFEVNELQLSKDDQHVYFKANVKHPGIYEIYRVNLRSKDMQPLTDLNGMTDYQLSPDETRLLLTHSTLTLPPELYTKAVGSSAAASKITDTVSEQFKQIDWIAPQIVPIPSSHTQQPIFSRVYLPDDYASGEKRKAVVFNHGAGYLQNSHLGWSGYFREYMFHNMLVQQGYVVLDMDYRASAGYGRDWRTAIYRHMGKPETEDLVDGVAWLAENANVDPARVGTYGGSYGGFMTFMALFTEPDLFQAGAALRPVSDWAHYNHGYTSNILNTPDVDPIAYERSSPIYFAEGLNKPLLINAPMIDSNVFFIDVVRLVQRLIELEKEDFETAIYPVESHGFVEPSSWLDEYRRIYKLFEENL